MANIRFSVGLFVCCLVLAQSVGYNSEKEYKNTITCDQAFPKIIKNASKSLKFNASSVSHLYQSLDRLMLQYNSNYESGEYRRTP